MYVKDFPNAKSWLPGKIIEVRGPLSYHVELNDGRIVRRHVDAVCARSAAVHPNTNASDNDQEIPPIGVPETPDSADNSEAPEQPVPPPRRTSSRVRTQPDYFGVRIEDT